MAIVGVREFIEYQAPTVFESVSYAPPIVQESVIAAPPLVREEIFSAPLLTAPLLAPTITAFPAAPLIAPTYAGFAPTVQPGYWGAQPAGYYGFGSMGGGRNFRSKMTIKQRGRYVENGMGAVTDGVRCVHSSCAMHRTVTYHRPRCLIVILLRKLLRPPAILPNP